MSQSVDDLRVKRLLQEFAATQLPFALGLVLLAILAAFLTDGGVPSGDIPFGTSGVVAQWWELLLLGLVSGGLMALIGGGAALLALPYCVVVLNYTGLSITPTMLLVTLINPLGAWMGFRSDGVFNREIALVFAVSAVVGGVLGPLVRLKLLSDPEMFSAVVGLALIIAAAEVFRGIIAQQAATKQVGDNSRSIKTLALSLFKIELSHGGRTWEISTPLIFFIGVSIGVISSAIGLGGGFILIPLLTIFFRMPLPLVAAASIPYIIALSCSGLAAYGFLAPVVGEKMITPDWALGLFIAAGGLIGGWLGAKAQQAIPHRVLNLVLGTSVGLTGVVYIAKAVFKL